MLLDRVFAATFRNLSTLFLVAFVVLLPLHLVHSYVFRNVIEVRELHDEIEKFPPSRQVHGVGTQQLDRARISFWALAVLELLALPLGARAARAVLETERRGELPTVLGAVRAVKKPMGPGGWAQKAGPVVAASALFGLIAAWLLEGAGQTLVQMLPDRTEFVGVALVQASARALGGSFVIVALAQARAGGRRGSETLDLY
jgi:hypothetical protein